MQDINILSKIITMIENNLNTELNLNSIAEEAGYSKYHLNRLFYDETGLTIHKYIKQRRLTMAANELVHSDKPIVDISMDANYASQQAFTLAFRQEYHCTPYAYRMNGRFTPKQLPISTIKSSILYMTTNLRMGGKAA